MCGPGTQIGNILIFLGKNHREPLLLAVWTSGTTIKKKTQSHLDKSLSWADLALAIRLKGNASEWEEPGLKKNCEWLSFLGVSYGISKTGRRREALKS